MIKNHLPRISVLGHIWAYPKDVTMRTNHTIRDHCRNFAIYRHRYLKLQFKDFSSETASEDTISGLASFSQRLPMGK